MGLVGWSIEFKGRTRSVRRCKSAYGLCKGAKVNTKTGRGVRPARLRMTRLVIPTRGR